MASLSTSLFILYCLITDTITQSTPWKELSFIRTSIMDKSGASSGGTMVITLWYNTVIYQYNIADFTQNTVHDAYVDSSPYLQVITNQNCFEFQPKVMVELATDDATFIESISIHTTDGTWYAFSGICRETLQPDFIFLVDDTVCDSGYYHYAHIGIDEDDPLDFAPHKQLVYFDTTRPDEVIDDALMVDGTDVTPETETCNPTKDPTKNPTLAPISLPTLPPTSIPTYDPTLAPTYDPTLAPTSLPSLHPTSMPTLAPILHPTSIPTLASIPTIEPTLYPFVIAESTASNTLDTSVVISSTATTLKTVTKDGAETTMTSDKITIPNMNEKDESAQSGSNAQKSTIATIIKALVLIALCSVLIACVIGIFVYRKRTNMNKQRDPDVPHMINVSHISAIELSANYKDNESSDSDGIYEKYETVGNNSVKKIDTESNKDEARTTDGNIEIEAMKKDKIALGLRYTVGNDVVDVTQTLE